MQFAHPILFYLALALAPLLAAGMLWAAWRRRLDLQAFAAPPLLERLTPHLSGPRRTLKTLAWGVGVWLLAMAWAGPQWGSRMVEVRRQGVDVLIAIDVSRSMLAEDVKPNRLQRAQQELTALIDRLDGDRIGVMAFAGNAEVMCPLTTDYDAAKMYLGGLTTESVAVPGTSLGEAIRTSLEAFPKGGEGFRVLVLLTDGEDHHSEPEAAAQAAKAAGVRILTIGFGTPGGEPIPVRDDAGHVTGYLKDARGQTVVSQVDAALLKRLADITGGAYWPSASGSLEADRLAETIGRMQKRDFGAGQYGVYEERYQWFLLPALLLLLASFWLPVRKHAWLLVLPLLLGLHTPAQAGLQGDVNAGNRAYRKGQYDQAVQRYQDAQIADPDSPVVPYDLGNALHRQEKWDDAEKAYQQAVRAKDPDLQLRSWYNLGNTFMQARKYPDAIAAYGRALRVKPKDPDTLQNLALALRYLKQPPPKDQKKKQDQNQDQKQKQNQSNQNQGQQNPQNKSGQQGKNSQSQRGQKPQGPDDKGEQQAKSDAKQDTPDTAKASPPKPGEMSREDAQNLLDSVREAEQEAQRKRTSGVMDRGKGKRQVPEDW